MSNLASIRLIVFSRAQIIKDSAKRLDYFNVLFLVMTTNIISSARFAIFKYGKKSSGMVFNVQPIPHLISFAVNWQILSILKLLL